MGCLKIAELLGPPRAGKSTYLRNIIPELEKLGLLKKYIPDKIRWAPGENEIEKNIWVLAGLSQAFIESDQSKGLIIIERGAWAYKASLIAHSKRKSIRSQKQKIKIETALNLAELLTKKESLFIFIDISFEEALRRDREAGAEDYGRIINPKFFPILKEVYQELLQQMPTYKTRFINGEDDMLKNQDKLLKMLIKFANCDSEKK